VERLLRVVRRVAGMPDYAAYVEHHRSAHPERPVPSPRRFYDDYLRARFGDGPTRCC
jgi:uncharacterized short protein YbdD (DUF466 family)